MRINRTNPEQPAAQPVQSHAPIKAQTEVNGFEPPEQGAGVTAVLRLCPPFPYIRSQGIPQSRAISPC